MRRLYGILAVVGLLMIGGTVYAADFAASGSMEETEIAGNTGASMTKTTKTCWKNGNLRVEHYDVDGTRVEIVAGKDYYVYDPQGKRAVKAEVPAGQRGNVKQLLGGDVNRKAIGKRIGGAVIAGIQCDEFRISKSGVTENIWISTNPHFPIPLKIEKRAGTMHDIIETKNVHLNISIQDSMFKVPSGTKVAEQKTPKSPPQPRVTPSSK